MKECELKEHHFNMWSFIMEEILKKRECVDIVQMKRSYCDNKNIELEKLCALCEYVKERSEYGCCDCPSTLSNIVDTYECLGGIYNICQNTSEFETQYKLARIIRDSWR